ncbi:MAG: ADP-ribosylglycohydrolase family protein [Chthonomonadales bacterium]|nr:ADP-ribosylglycohydrolase family protein [Chthonomonadales bacterium]
MADLTIPLDDCADRVLGGWLGKNVGGTLGAPFEGKVDPPGVTFYDPAPVQPAASDDLDLELLWLHALEEHGPELTSGDLAGEWMDHVRYSWDEYAYATVNLRRGARPPLSGSHGNWFASSVGAAGRAGIWAMAAPGCPDHAAELAYHDAVLDHAGEGVWAAMFLAALESAAFFVRDIATLLDIGLARVPDGSRVCGAIRAAREAHGAAKTAMQARSAVLDAVGCPNPTDAPQNLGFIALGLLYGEGDFANTLCATVNCGYDTDTTGATVGAIMGIRGGAKGLPERWLAPIGRRIVVGWGVEGLSVPATVDELTERTMAVTARMIEARRLPVRMADLRDPAAPMPTEAPQPGEPASEAPPPPNADSDPPATSNIPSTTTEDCNWLDAARSSPLFGLNPSVSVDRRNGVEASFDCAARGPAIVAGVASSFVVTLTNLRSTPIDGHVEVTAPRGWIVAVPGAQGPTLHLDPGRAARLGFAIKAPEAVESAEINPIALTLTPEDGEPVRFAVPIYLSACWWFIGPLKNDFGGGFEKGYTVEDTPDLTERHLGRGDGLVGWRRMPFGRSVMEIEELFTGLPGVAYGLTILRRTEPLEARLIVHTNDGVRVWLNDRLVYQVHDHRPFRPTLTDGPGAKVQLRAGENRLRIKVVRCDQPAKLAISWLDAAGVPILDAGNQRY